MKIVLLRLFQFEVDVVLEMLPTQLCSYGTHVLTALMRRFAVFHFHSDALSLDQTHRLGVFSRDGIRERVLELFLGLLLVVVVVQILQRNVRIHVPRLIFTDLFVMQRFQYMSLGHKQCIAWFLDGSEDRCS